MQVPDFNILDMRVIHFEKLLPQHEANGDGTKSDLKEGPRRNYQRFCSLGYYDQMSYVRAKDEESILDYKHCFLIKYPYQQSQQRMVTDQMFTLLNEDGDWENDPFEIGEDEEKPFLGIILLTVGKKFSDSKEDSKSSIYERLLEVYKNASIEILGKVIDSKEKNGYYRLFYTPNCADLCIVIRTNNLQDIYNVKEQISAKKVSETEEIICHTTAYTLLQTPEKMWSGALIEKNKELWLELRLYAPECVIAKIKDCLDRDRNINGNIYGITGSGQYALELDFAAFASIYPLIWQIKAGADVFGEVKSRLQKVFKENVSALKCSYMRVKYQQHSSGESETNNMSGLCQVAQELVEKYEKDIVSFTKEKVARGSYQVSSLKEQKSMLRELYYTYNDFWFRPTSWWKGVVFYAQIEGVMSGVRQYEDMANKMSRSPEKLIQQTCRDLEQAIFSINSFNKLLQSVNQYVVNIPNYEMQTKVNIEKYLMAYTMYLFEISSKYYQRHTEVERILPFFLLDFNASKLEAYVLFGKKSMMLDAGEQKEDKNNNTSKPWTTLVAVKCPNYQWFANVYHVLPMITHEMSHNFRYLSQKKRNEFVFRFIVAFLSKYMMEKILEESEIDCRKIHYGNRERFFLKHIRAVINEELSEFVEQYSDSMKLQDLGVYLGKEFLKITGLHEYLYQEYHTASLIYEDLLHLFQLTKTGYIRPEDFEDDFWNCKEAKLKGSELFFNILLDLLHPKKGESMYEEWDAAIKKVDGTQVRESRKNLYQSIKGMLKSYNEGGIPYAYILRIPLKHLEIWERNDEQLCDLEKNDKNINHIMEALKQRKISRAQKLLNDREEKRGEGYSNIRVDIQTEYYEKLSEFADCYGNIHTRIQANYLKAISRAEKKDPVKKFAQKMHSMMYEEYIKMLDSRHTYANRWITYKKNQRLLTSLGIIDENPEPFVNNYRQVLRGITEGEIQTIIKDQIQNYEEVFADYGMCKAFSFTAYGYFMYLIHIFMKERDVPKSGLKDLSADRIRTLLLSFYRDELSEFNSKLKEFWEDLKQALQTHRDELSEGYQALCEVSDFKEFTQEYFDKFMKLYDEKEKKNVKLDRELYKQVWILRWASFLYRGLQLDIELTDEEDELMNKLYIHVLDVNKEVDSSDSDHELWIKMCHEDENLKDIGEYYNNYKYSTVMEGIRKGRCLKHQNQFVFDYYSRMFDCIHSMKTELKHPETASKEILELLFGDCRNSFAEEGE